MRRLLLVALAIATAASPAAGGQGTAAASSGSVATTAALAREVAQLRLERDLASGKGFYLRLDAARQRLALMLQGVTLDDYATAQLEWGVPEVVFVDRRPPADWDASPISRGRLEPERDRDRLEVVAPPLVAADAKPAEGASPSPPPIPKSAEESYSVPSPYRVVFAEGVSLEVRAKGHGGRNRSLFRRLLDAASLRAADLASALRLGATERVRLRVTLEADDAAALYRSLPPDVGLIVVGLKPR
jgi:hypothetical protein